MFLVITKTKKRHPPSRRMPFAYSNRNSKPLHIFAKINSNNPTGKQTINNIVINFISITPLLHILTLQI